MRRGGGGGVPGACSPEKFKKIDSRKCIFQHSEKEILNSMPFILLAQITDFLHYHGLSQHMQEFYFQLTERV